MARVLRTPEANADLIESWSHVANDSPVIADRLVESIGAKCELLAEFPQMGRRREELAPRLRSFSIELIRVLHGARDIDSLFDR